MAWREADFALVPGTNTYQRVTVPETVPVPRFLTLPDAAPEDALRSRIQALCKVTGHLYFHPYHSKRSTSGFPDDVIVHPEGDMNGGSTLFLWELKRKEGEVSGTQQRWLDALTKVTRVEVTVYRPHDLDRIIEKLRRNL